MRTYLMKKLTDDLFALAQASYNKTDDHAAAALKVAVQELVDPLGDKIAQAQGIAGDRIIRLVCAWARVCGSRSAEVVGTVVSGAARARLILVLFFWDFTLVLPSKLSVSLTCAYIVLFFLMP